MTVKHGDACRSLLEDARLLQETYRRERNLARKELQDLRVELAHAYDLRDAERKRADRAEADRDRLDHQVAALKAEAADLRQRIARPLIPETPVHDCLTLGCKTPHGGAA